ncbi:hypothetical protein AVMA1855_03820 [Acidovorax sp. SUPP1855]|uniref:hypothetical protein n=1 Tax=Acidovorax sp. SUPP1855 TaxID=431774 RepID=UPI0023DE1FC7|nr:hypothetical protein [Acidovorax sp. SUPP1855]GKS83238.1 hypothetical protein AVMA1855_03820 [Acidovorax sp. SUPP1855]
MKRALKPAEPTSLHDQAMAFENTRHAQRLAQIKSMASKLRTFDSNYMPAIRAAGIPLHADEFNCWGKRSALYICGATLNPQRNANLETLLRKLGMRETKRTNYPTGGYAIDLTKGHLTVHLSVDSHRLPKPAEAVTCA